MSEPENAVYHITSVYIYNRLRQELEQTKDKLEAAIEKEQSQQQVTHGLVYRARPFSRYAGSGRGKSAARKGPCKVIAEAKLINGDHTPATHSKSTPGQ